MKAEIRIKRLLFSGLNEVAYQIKVPIGPDEINGFSRLIYDTCVPLEAKNGGELINVKGRDHNRRLLGQASLPDTLIDEEIFFISGKLFNELEETSERWKPFSVKIASKFNAFKNKKSIAYSAKYIDVNCSHDDLFSSLNDSSLVRIRELRFGLEFLSTSFASMFGFAPGVSEGILLECSINLVNVTLFSTKTSDIKCPTFFKLQSLQTIETALLQLSSAKYKEHVSEEQLCSSEGFLRSSYKQCLQERENR